ncbi:hypothetical protein Nepgr_012194 [Nepenthes gracilis]|uniref:Uncharacterized protein n=1 Tax=Nepenthes gracilis TaxID=150966 RepID=A0AAD3SFI0_NEPGR|nr:hypothetical protein Nepgr_012194 [Nepenthes gracilis]
MATEAQREMKTAPRDRDRKKILHPTQGNSSTERAGELRCIDTVSVPLAQTATKIQSKTYNARETGITKDHLSRLDDPSTKSAMVP